MISYKKKRIIVLMQHATCNINENSNSNTIFCAYRSKPSTPMDILVWTGVDSIPSNITLHQVEEIKIHEKYLRNSVDYNLALIRVRLFNSSVLNLFT